jgi:hypothetical protein
MRVYVQQVSLWQGKLMSSKGAALSPGHKSVLFRLTAAPPVNGADLSARRIDMHMLSLMTVL